MTKKELTTQVQTSSVEKALLEGNLAQLQPVERLNYYKAVCESLQLNPLTKPFGYIAFKTGELKLYALKDCTEQLRARDEISVTKIEKIEVEGCIAFCAYAISGKNKRTDSSIGAVNSKGLSGEALANAVMKAETKAKRRVTLSICGLGFLDESELHSIEGARVVSEDFLPNVEAPKLPESKPLPKANFYLYDIKLLDDEAKRTNLKNFFITNKITEVSGSEGVYASPMELKKINSILVGERNSI